MPTYKIAIVGGAGFVGSALATHFSEKFNVRILDKKSPPQELLKKVEYRQCDIRNIAQVKKGFEGIDLVIHTAIIQIPQINEVKKLGYGVNVIGTQNICKVIDETPSIKGMILAGSWHLFGERDLKGPINEEFGFRPDKVEERARLYVLSKILQETITRFYEEMSEKTYGVIRLGTVLGEGMPEKTAANIFITKGINGEPLTPYEHSMYRPMLYVDLDDVCKAFELYANKILNIELLKERNSTRIVNLCYPEPITILDLANLVKDLIVKYSRGKIRPKVKIVKTGKPSLFNPEHKKLMKVDIRRVKDFLGIEKMTHPAESIGKIILRRLRDSQIEF